MTMAESWIRRMVSALRALVPGNGPEREMEEEVRFHLEMATRRNVERGMSPDEARRRALAAFGGVTQHREAARDDAPGQWLEGLQQDLKYAVRTLRRNPGFTVSVVLTLALGIGANTAIFSVVNGVLIRPLPVPEPEQLTLVGWDFGKGVENQTLSAFKFDYLRRHSRAFAGLATHRIVNREIGEPGRSEPVGGLRIAGDFFRVVGSTPVLGRAFSPDEYRPGGAAVVVLSDALWRTRFAADPGIVGKAVLMDGKPVTVVGVMPPSFRFPFAPLGNRSFIVPAQLEFDPADQGHNYLVLGRLRPGQSREQVASDLEMVADRLSVEHPRLASDDTHFMLFDYQRVYVGETKTTLLILQGAVAFVLLIAAVNAANLLIARAASRQREVMVRAALGAGRSRILRQLLSEGLLLSLVAGAIGLALGVWGVRALLAFMPGELPRADEIGLDYRVLAFTVAVVTLTAIVFGLAAALPSRRLNLAAALGERARGNAATGRSRDLLVMAETAFAIILLTGAGLLIATFAKLRGTDPGFAPENVTTVRFGRMPEGYGTMTALWELERQLVERIEQIPGVERAAGLSSFPLERGLNYPVAITGVRDHGDGSIEWRTITPGYFEALRVPLLRGRTFSAADARNSPKVAIVNASLANRFFPGQDPIGKRIDIGRYKDQWMSKDHQEPVEIVGVAADMREVRLNADPRRTVYVPMAQAQDGMTPPPFLVVRTARPVALRPAIEAAVRAVDPRVTPRLEPLPAIVSESIAGQRFQATLLSVFAASALALTAIGIFGVVAYGVQQRVREIGVRVALGASVADVIRLIVGRSLAFVSAGATIGVIAAIGLTRFMAGKLYGVTPTDPLTFALAVSVLLGVALLASYIPARRVARIDPVTALRLE
jgi:predicted permease